MIDSDDKGLKYNQESKKKSLRIWNMDAKMYSTVKLSTS